MDEQCGVCKAAKTIVIKCAKEKKLSDEVIFLFKPIICSKCNERFSDVTNLKAHTDIVHCSQTHATESTRPSHSLIKTRFKSMSVTELKTALREKGLSTSDNKEILVRRLESVLPNAK